jgi:hypothetical protein
MIAEVKQAKRYLGARFGYGETLPVGSFSVPTEGAHGSCFMRVRVERDGSMSDFTMWWDEACTISYHAVRPRPSDLPYESEFAQAFRMVEKAQRP